MTHQEAGHLSNIHGTGGRPRALTIADIKSIAKPSPRKYEGGKLPSSLRAMKGMVRELENERRHNSELIGCPI
jgi:hypothetical protein